jgi:exopolyphosphatase/guanosine-5'-triphosphate,3'-diphosphate pyrophosphatase
MAQLQTAPLTEVVTPSTVGFIDIGTNSVRLLVVRLQRNRAFTVIHQLKETVRLGEDAFRHQHLRADAMERAIAVLRQFAMLARAAGAHEIIAVATAATREAENRHVFLDRLREEAQLDVHVISGLEEARLIYAGVASGLHLGKRKAWFIDIGGGSTEVSVGNETEQADLASLPLGAIRLSDEFFSHRSGRVSSQAYERLRAFVRSEAAQELRELKRLKPSLAVGSSGTIENLADVASYQLHGEGGRADDGLSSADLQKTIGYLRSLTLEERRKVPGLNPARADIIIGGAAVLEVLMEDTGARVLQVSSRGLREGLLADYLRRHGHGDLVGGDSVRRRSVVQLGRRCNFHEPHAEATARLALELFESGREAGLHDYGEPVRELLEYAALLHHIGAFLTYSGYQRHSEYLIRNADLLGFDEDEVAMIATIVRFHRSTVPRANEHALAGFAAKDRGAVRAASVFLRLAESLDRSQAQVAGSARLERLGHDRVVLHAGVKPGWEAELGGLDSARRAFAKVFDASLVVEAVPA